MSIRSRRIACVSEYNFSIPGVLKNAIDWASRRGTGTQPPLDGKPAAIIGTGGRMGTVRAQMHLRDILIHNDVHLLNRPALMLPKAGMHFDDAGNLINDEARERLRNVLVALHDWTIRLNGHK